MLLWYFSLSAHFTRRGLLCTPVIPQKPRGAFDLLTCIFVCVCAPAMSSGGGSSHGCIETQRKKDGWKKIRKSSQVGAGRRRRRTGFWQAVENWTSHTQMFTKPPWTINNNNHNDCCDDRENQEGMTDWRIILWNSLWKYLLWSIWGRRRQKTVTNSSSPLSDKRLPERS